MEKTWRDFAPDDPEGLRYWVKYDVEETIKAGYFTEADDEKAQKIHDEVQDRIMKELKEYIENYQSSAGTPSSLRSEKQ